MDLECKNLSEGKGNPEVDSRAVGNTPLWTYHGNVFGGRAKVKEWVDEIFVFFRIADLAEKRGFSRFLPVAAPAAVRARTPG
jgi:hypothetical protein